MQSYIERRDLMLKVIDDEEIKPKETFLFLWDWLNFEIAVMRQRKARNKLYKHGKRMNTTIDVVNLRKEMAHL